MRFRRRYDFVKLVIERSMKYLLIGVLYIPLAFGVDLKPGSYDLVAGDKTHCETGEIRIVKDEGIETFTIGSRISFELNDSATKNGVAGCEEKHQVKKSAKEILAVTEIKSCPAENKNLEDKIIRKVTIKNSDIFYEHTSSVAHFKCQYKQGQSK